MAKRVCIDAGHYAKYNRSPGIPKYYESDMVWKLHLLQKKYLEQLGIEVITTRPDKNKDLALVDRGKAAKGCDLFISDHSNAVGSVMNEDIDFVAVYHLTEDTTTKADDISKEIANKLAPIIAKVMGTKQNYRVLTRLEGYDRNSDGIMNDNYYGVLHGARLVNVPGLIIEHSFHTNTKAVKWLLVDDNLDKLARAEAECIASYLLGKTVSLNKKSDKKTDAKKETATKPIYKVQVGAYSKIEPAKKQMQLVKSKGFDAIVIKVDRLYKVQVGAYSDRKNAENMLKNMKKAGLIAFITTENGQTVTTSTKVSQETSKETYDEMITRLAKEVWAGKHGIGNVRRKALGEHYDAVQKKIRELYY